jgi:hypothetical protein
MFLKTEVSPSNIKNKKILRRPPKRELALASAK